MAAPDSGVAVFAAALNGPAIPLAQSRLGCTSSSAAPTVYRPIRIPSGTCLRADSVRKAQTTIKKCLVQFNSHTERLELIRVGGVVPLLATLCHWKLGRSCWWPGHVSLTARPQTQLLLPALQAPLLAEQAQGCASQWCLRLALSDLPDSQCQLCILSQVAILRKTNRCVRE